jgi:hypothetical protein
MSFEIFKQCIDKNDLDSARTAIIEIGPAHIDFDTPLFYAAKVGKCAFVSLFLHYAGMLFVGICFLLLAHTQTRSCIKNSARTWA